MVRLSPMSAAVRSVDLRGERQALLRLPPLRGAILVPVHGRGGGPRRRRWRRGFLQRICGGPGGRGAMLPSFYGGRRTGGCVAAGTLVGRAGLIARQKGGWGGKAGGIQEEWFGTRGGGAGRRPIEGLCREGGTWSSWPLVLGDSADS